MPKCEIFDRLDFCDFYTIKSLWVGEFGAKIKYFLNLEFNLGARPFLTRMLSLILRTNFFVVWPKKFLGGSF